MWRETEEILIISQQRFEGNLSRSLQWKGLIFRFEGINLTVSDLHIAIIGGYKSSLHNVGSNSMFMCFAPWTIFSNNICCSVLLSGVPSSFLCEVIFSAHVAPSLSPRELLYVPVTSSSLLRRVTLGSLIPYFRFLFLHPTLYPARFVLMILFQPLHFISFIYTYTYFH